MAFSLRNIIGLLMAATVAVVSCRSIDVDSGSKLAAANNHLALAIHKRLAASSSGNIFFSPFSLSSAFGMLYFGSRGKTAQELRQVLGYEAANLDKDEVHSLFHQYLTEVLPSKDNAYILDTANAVLVDKNQQLAPGFKSSVQDLYQATVREVDFVRDTPRVVQDINNWVKEKTHGKIEKLFDDLDPSTIVALLNAVYFKGTWKTQFEKKRTYDETFYNGGLETNAKKVPMMHMTTHLPYTTVFDCEALELPYKGENVSMLVLLPTARDGLSALESSLNRDKLAVIRKQLFSTKVIVTLPKFKVEYSKELSPEFQDLGARSIFRPEADFSGMTLENNVYVSQVVHKAVVEVNEEGSEAAAVTGIISNRMRPIADFVPNFTADHPFLFAIVDNRSDMILFMGRVNNL